MEQKILDFVVAYNAIWNEPDAGRRREAIAQLWSEEAKHYTDNHELQGHDAIEARVAEAYHKFVEHGAYVFRLLGNVSSHHNAVRLSWIMVPQKGGEATAAGTVFVLLGAAGRIICDYQFTDEIQAKERS